ncbi:MAG: hypothetical protein HKN76_19255, partial [Saprospiraceae bacterium]|nr:hypothetical protein [Saprospiraceae bacterium]
HIDFRPFKKGVNIAEQKDREEQAEASREVISYSLKNRLTGKVVELPYAQYMAEFKSYPRTDWEIIETKMTESEVEHTKISDFIIYGPDDEDVTDQLLTNPNPYFLLICHKLYYDSAKSVEVEVSDTTAVIADTVIIGTDTSFVYEPKITTRRVNKRVFEWDKNFLDRFTSIILPFTKEAEAVGVKSVIVIGGADTGMITDFKDATGIDFTACSADDILLKTIIRSNPGIVLMKQGQILDKWHYRHLPSFDQVQAKYIK